MISNVGNTLLSSPMHQLECLNIVDEIIDGMDDKGILELMQGSGGDLDWVLDNLMKDTYQVMYTGDPNIDFAPKYTERLSASIEADNELMKEQKDDLYKTLQSAIDSTIEF